MRNRNDILNLGASLSRQMAILEELDTRCKNGIYELSQLNEEASRGLRQSFLEMRKNISEAKGEISEGIRLNSGFSDVIIIKHESGKIEYKKIAEDKVNDIINEKIQYNILNTTPMQEAINKLHKDKIAIVLDEKLNDFFTQLCVQGARCTLCEDDLKKIELFLKKDEKKEWIDVYGRNNEIRPELDKWHEALETIKTLKKIISLDDEKLRNTNITIRDYGAEEPLLRNTSEIFRNLDANNLNTKVERLAKSNLEAIENGIKTIENKREKIDIRKKALYNKANIRFCISNLKDLIGKIPPNINTEEDRLNFSIDAALDYADFVMRKVNSQSDNQDDIRIEKSLGEEIILLNYSENLIHSIRYEQLSPIHQEAIMRTLNFLYNRQEELRELYNPTLPEYTPAPVEQRECPPTEMSEQNSFNNIPYTNPQDELDYLALHRTPVGTMNDSQVVHNLPRSNSQRSI